MGVLFLAGNRLVDRQQQYKNSELAPAKKTFRYGVFTVGTGAPKMQLTNRAARTVVADRRALKNAPM